jgi:hypothetical protein
MVVRDMAGQVCLDVHNLFANGLDQGLDAHACSLVAHRQAVALGHQHLHQLAPAQHQRVQPLLFVRGQRLDQLLTISAVGQYRSERSQHLRIDTISLGQIPHRFGEVARLPRIDYRHRQTCCLATRRRRALHTRPSLP